MKCKLFGVMFSTFQGNLVVLHFHYALLATLVIVEGADSHDDLNIVGHEFSTNESMII
jgi:hypothetical protein